MMSFISLRKRFLKGLLSMVLLVTLNGCVYLVVGSVGAIGGYVISPDTVEGILTGHEYDSVWDATMETIAVMGIIQERNDAAGTVIANIQGTAVTVTAVRMSQTAIKLTVKARKVFLPKIKVAQDVYIKIEQYLFE